MRPLTISKENIKRSLLYKHNSNHNNNSNKKKLYSHELKPKEKEIKINFSSCIAVSVINFSNSLLPVELPQSLGDLKNLQSVDVFSNQLSGCILETLGEIDTVTFLNLPFNNLEGMIPSGGIFNSVSTFMWEHYRHILVLSKETVVSL